MAKKVTLSLTEGRKKIFEIADEVDTENMHYVLTEHGTPKIAIISAKELASWEETIHLLSTGALSPSDVSHSYTHSAFSSLEHILEKEGFIVADNARKKYDPKGSPASKSKKKNRKS